MNEYELNKSTGDVQAKECHHCWHGTGQMLTSNPPQIPEVCCHCGEHRTRSQQVFYTTTGHGPYFSQTMFYSRPL